MARKLHFIEYGSSNMDGEYECASSCGLNQDSECEWDGTRSRAEVSCKRCLTNLAKPKVSESWRKDRPILFNGPMVRAILAGQKTVTRRPVKGDQIPHRSSSDVGREWIAVGQHDPRYGFVVSGETEEACAAELGVYGVCPYGRARDLLWVREAWVADAQVDSIAPRDLSQGEPIWYPADGTARQTGCSMISQGRGRPSIHMPRWASRILLEITDIRVERLQGVTEEQARAEGITDGGCTNCGHNEPCGCDCPAPSAVDSFVHLWNSTGGDWQANPWVWVVEFKRVDTACNDNTPSAAGAMERTA